MNLTSPYPSDSIDDSAAQSGIYGFCARLLGGLFAVFVIVACFAVARRGPWLDEFWSIWQAQHDLPWAEIVRQRWMADFNPPLFSLTHWAFEPLLGDSVLNHRMLNLVGAAWAACFAVVAIRRFPQRTGFVLTFAAILLALPTTMLYVAEMRSYFPQTCAYFVLVNAVVLILDPDVGGGRDLDWRIDKGFALMTLATIAAAINLHYISTLLAWILVGGLIAMCLLRGWMRWSAALAATAIISTIPLVWYLYAQLSFLLDSSKDYWLHETMSEAASTLLFTAVAAMRSNSLALLIAALSLVFSVAMGVPTFRHALQAQGVAVLDADFKRRLALTKPRVQTAALLFGVLVTFTVAMLIASTHQPLVSERYLLNFEVVCVGLIACLASGALASRRLLTALLVAMAVLGMANNARKVAREERWSATAQKVSEYARACRTSPIYAGVIKRPTFSKNELVVHEWTFGKLAQQYGLGVKYVDLSTAKLQNTDKACPALLWVEHVDWPSIRPKPTAGELLRVLALPSDTIDVARAELFTSDSGFVLKLPAK